MINKPKFKYSSLGKAFEKQIKTIENQGEKQIKTIEEHGKRRAKSNAFVENDSLPLSEQKKLFYKFIAERINIIE